MPHLQRQERPLLVLRAHYVCVDQGVMRSHLYTASCMCGWRWPDVSPLGYDLPSDQSEAEARHHAAVHLWSSRPLVKAERDQLREGIEEYLLWRPGERGHAEAHRKLAALVRDTEAKA